MKLPNGIAGFFDSKTNELPQVDGKKFKQLCFDFAIRNDGKVIDFNTPQYPRKFYYVQVEIPYNNQFYILLNQHYPYLAFASVVGDWNVEFINEPACFEYFSPSYKVMGTEELNIPLNQILGKENELNSGELEQITHWEPKTVGEIIFNYWD